MQRAVYSSVCVLKCEFAGVLHQNVMCAVFLVIALCHTVSLPLLPPPRLIPNTETTLESSLLQEEVEEEEVWLYWIDSHKEPHGKSIRHLAQDAKGTHKMDVDIITYYRCLQHSFLCARPPLPSNTKSAEASKSEYFNFFSSHVCKEKFFTFFSFLSPYPPL